MILSKKFYDPAIGDNGGGQEEAGTETIAQEPIAEVKKEEKPSIAALMAKQGIKSENGIKTERSDVNKENKEQNKKADEVAPVETTIETQKAELKEPKSPQQEEDKSVKTQKEETPKTNSTLQEVLKSQQPDSVLKELGFDDKTVKLVNKLKGFEKIDFFSNLIDEWQNKGNLKEYLRELTTDYEKMPPEEVMKHQLREEYPKASEQALNALFKKKIVQAYNLDSEDDSEVAEGTILLEAEADKYRDSLLAKQKTKLFPDVPEQEIVDPAIQEKQAQQEFDSYKSTVLNNDFSKDVFENKRIVIGKGKGAFNYPIEPDVIQGIMFDDNKWLNTQFNTEQQSDGSFKITSPKIENQILTAAFAMNPEKFLKEYAKHYESLGSEKTVESIDNAKQKNQPYFSQTEGKPKDAAEAMAKNGRLGAGGVN